ncbi:MAG: AEC family transporter [Nitrospirae bacterium]|nr:AEC family transporter [Nitrospirota bacterium]
MYGVLAQTAALIAFGVAWRLARPWGLEADATRRVLTSLVYVLLLPALVLDVLWRAPLGLDAVRVASVAACGVVAGVLVSWGWYRVLPVSRSAVGALILASAFGNVTYLGLPVLESTFGSWARSVAIEYDLFASTPLLLTVGILIARVYGKDDERERAMKGLLKVPALWAALIGVGVNLAGAPTPGWVGEGLGRLAAGVVPLMLISIGLGLTWQKGRATRVPVLFPVLAIRFVLTPLVVCGVAALIGVKGDLLGAVVLEAAMPSMVLGIVICDRYGLDTALYAQVVTLSTAASLFVLPIWHRVVA